MARGDAIETGPGHDIRDYDLVQIYDLADSQGRGDQADQEIERRAQQWHGVID